MVGFLIVRNSIVSGKKKNTSKKETYVEHSRTFSLQIAVFSYIASLIPISQNYVQNTQINPKIQEVSGNKSSDTEKSVKPSTLQTLYKVLSRTALNLSTASSFHDYNHGSF